MKLSRSKCVLIILADKKNRALLNLRDNNPDIAYPSMWALVGGAPETSEEIDSAIRREVKEELVLSNGNALKLSDIRFLFQYERTDIRKTEYVFYSLLSYDLKKLIPKEGVKLGLFTKDQIQSSDQIAPHHKDILLMYYSRQS